MIQISRFKFRSDPTFASSSNRYSIKVAFKKSQKVFFQKEIKILLVIVLRSPAFSKGRPAYELLCFLFTKTFLSIKKKKISISKLGDHLQLVKILLKAEVLRNLNFQNRTILTGLLKHLDN